MRHPFMLALLLLTPLVSAQAQLSIQFNMPSVSIGFSQPHYPQLVAVPGYPVYYDPSASSNYFFYDGLYWVYEGDNWYASDWYDGPWALVQPHAVPVFILRVPVSYYRHPPAYFRGWQGDSAPRWGEYYGHDWERQRSGWDRWDRQSAPPPAPLPVYQKQYSGNRYPQGDQQRAIRTQNYRHEPRDTAVKEVYKARNQDRGPSQPPPQQKQRAEPARQAPPQPQQRAEPARQGTPQQPLHYVEQPRQAPPQQQQRAEPARQAPSQQQQRAAPQEKGQQGQREEPKNRQDQGQQKREGQGPERNR